MLFILYVFASFGLAFILGYAKITHPLRSALYSYAEAVVDPPRPAVLRWAARWLLQLLECPACVAFWLGLVCVFTPIVGEIAVLGVSSPWVLAPALGLANTGAVLALGMITGLIRTE